MDHLSVKDIIVLAAYRAARDFGGVEVHYTTEDLVVLSYRLCPDRFSLRGYTEYPDSQRVKCELVAYRGALGDGTIERVGRGIYRLTDKGMERGYQLDTVLRAAN